LRLQLAGIFEGPAMVGAGEAFAAAFMFAANDGAAMRAGVYESRNLAIAAVGEDKVFVDELPGDKIIGFRNFRHVTKIEPAFIEELVFFGFKDRRVCIDFAVDLKAAGSGINPQVF
jgi:hypothetical protein